MARSITTINYSISANRIDFYDEEKFKQIRITNHTNDRRISIQILLNNLPPNIFRCNIRNYVIPAQHHVLLEFTNLVDKIEKNGKYNVKFIIDGEETLFPIELHRKHSINSLTPYFIGLLLLYFFDLALNSFLLPYFYSSQENNNNNNNINYHLDHTGEFNNNNYIINNNNNTIEVNDIKGAENFSSFFPINCFLYFSLGCLIAYLQYSFILRSRKAN